MGAQGFKLAFCKLQALYIIAIDFDGKTPLHYAAERGMAQTAANVIGIWESHLKDQQIKIHAIGYIHAKDKYNKTALDYALESNCPDLVKLLLPYASRRVLKGALCKAKNEEFRALIKSAFEFRASQACQVIGNELLKQTPDHDIIRNALEECTVSSLNNPAYGGNFLREAVNRGHNELISDFLNNGTNANTQDQNGNTVLHLAATNNNLRAIRALLEHGREAEVIDGYLAPSADAAEVNINKLFLKIVRAITPKLITEFLNEKTNINARNQAGETSLSLALTNGHAEAADILLNNGARLDIADNCGERLLVKAAGDGHYNTVELLLRHGADPNAKFDDLDTALNMAAKMGRLEVLQLLLGYGADPNATGRFGYCPLTVSLASYSYNPSEEIALTLIRRMESLNSPVADVAPRTPLTAIFKNPQARAIIEAAVLKIEDINAQDQYGDAPLHLAVKNNNITAIELLLARNSDINAPAHDGSTPLTLAIEAQNFEVTGILLINGARPDIAGPSQEMPLAIAIRQCNWRASLLLVEYGADPNIEVEGQDSLIYLAVQQGDLNALQLLLAKGATAKIEDLELAFEKNNMEAARLILESCSAQLDIAGNTGEMLVVTLAKEYKWQAVQLLLQHGANPNTRIEGKDTPLHLAAKLKNLKAVQMLLGEGADPDVTGEYGDLPLKWALVSRQPEDEKLILKLIASMKSLTSPAILNGAAWKLIFKECKDVPIIEAALSRLEDINAQDQDGNTLLHLTVSTGNSTAIELLLNMGANASLTNNYGRTALHEAVLKADIEAIEAVAASSTLDREINAPDQDGNTALHLAVKEKNLTAIELLLAMGADASLTNHHGHTALHTAISRSKTGVIRALVASGKVDVDILSRGTTPRTALDLALTLSETDAALELLSLGADPRQPNVLWHIKYYRDTLDKKLAEAINARIAELNQAEREAALTSNEAITPPVELGAEESKEEEPVPSDVLPANTEGVAGIQHQNLTAEEPIAADEYTNAMNTPESLLTIEQAANTVEPAAPINSITQQVEGSPSTCTLPAEPLACSQNSAGTLNTHSPELYLACKVAGIIGFTAVGFMLTAGLATYAPFIALAVRLICIPAGVVAGYGVAYWVEKAIQSPSPPNLP